MAYSHDKKDAGLYQREVDHESSSDENHRTAQPSPEELSKLTGKTFDVDHGDFPWRDVLMRDPSSGNLKYFADVSVYSRHVADITLHTQAPDGPLAGQASFSGSRSIRCGLGTNEGSMEWVEMKRAGLMSVNTYQFQYRGKMYTISRTQDAGGRVSGIKGIILRHYKVVDETSGRAVGYYISDAMLGKKKGTLMLEAGVGSSLEALVVLAIVSVREKSRRRAARNGAIAGAASS